MDPASDWVTSGGKLASDFDGVNDYVVSTQGRQIGSQPFTVSAWIYPTTFANNRAVFDTLSISGSGGRTNDFVLYVTTAGLLQIYRSGGFGTVSTLAVTLNAWNFIALARIESTAAYYINSEQAGTTGLSTVVNGLNRNLGVFSDVPSGSGGFNNFQGLMDDIVEFNAGLTANEVREIYRLGRGYGVFPEPDFDEGFAAAAGFKAYWARRQSQLIGGGV
jgi:hypothetical protein